MFENTVGTHRLSGEDAELTQQFPPIFHALLTGALNAVHGGASEETFRRDPLAAPLPATVSASPSEVIQHSSLDEALVSTPVPASEQTVEPTAEPTRARLRAVPSSGGAHRAEAHAVQPDHCGRRTGRTGAHRAPDAEPRQPEQPAVARPATSRGGRHRTLRAVVH